VKRALFVADLERAIQPIKSGRHDELTLCELEAFRAFVLNYVTVAIALDAERARMAASLAELARLRGAL
jgi:hypothetical protein